MTETISDVLLWGLAFIFSTTCHEASHALTAKLGGDPTAYEAGQVTMNPWPHIKRSPFGMVLVPALSMIFSGFMIGWASAPYNPYWAERYPRRSALMALAGPAANFAIALICLALLRLGLAMDVFTLDVAARSYLDVIVAVDRDSLWMPIAELLSIMFTLNVVLGLFNLLPLPPLDGAEAILLFFPESQASQVRAKLQSIGMFGLLLAWIVFGRVGGAAIELAWKLVL